MMDERHCPEPNIPGDHECARSKTGAKEAESLSSWRRTGIGVLRIVFGIVWGIDAWFKWQPGFVNGFTDYLKGAQQDQPWPIHHWIGFWVNTIGLDPSVFAYGVAVGETVIAVALILGVFTNLTAVVGALFSLMIWSTAEGFGGPYKSGSTDIGAAVIYVLVFAGLLLSSSGLYLGLDRRLTAYLGRFGFLASGSSRVTAPALPSQRVVVP
jgi:thiosulfate dehydrogenase (quinone) large subunit